VVDGGALSDSDECIMMNSGFLTAEQRMVLEGIMRRQSEEHGVARRANAILLLDDGWDYEQIATALYISKDTVREWRKHFDNGGLDELTMFDWQGGQSRLSQSEEQKLTVWLRENPRRDTHEIRAHISNEYSKVYSHSGCIKLMHRLGFEYVKPKRVPAQADEQKQQEFIDNYKKLQRHLPEDAVVYFADAVHPEHQGRPARGWFFKGEKAALKSSSGRKRVNIHGAVNLENFDCPFVEVEKVNSDSTIALFEKIELRNPAKTAIYVFLDNAKYHHARAVKEWLAKTKSRIRPIFLPAYAPHLNPIERLWGVMHEYVTHNRFYPGFNEFAEAIVAFFEKTVPARWRDFRDRVSDNFRVIAHDNFRILE
jgi:transposase